jgi:hypothetical protein
MVRVHGRVWIEHNNTQEQKSLGLTAASDQRGGKLMYACEGGGIITAMQHSNGKVQRCSINHNQNIRPTQGLNGG